VNTLSAREAYKLWAPTYAQETTVSAIENEVVTRLAIPTAGKRLLDAGCGIARRLLDSDAAFCVGVDLSPEMLAHAATRTRLAAANVNALPLRDHQFDVVWCRLVMGHVPDAAEIYRQLARVCARSGTIVISDFHPAAVAAGHRRTFRDSGGVVREVVHHVHTAQAHIRAAEMAGLEPFAQDNGVVGASIRDFYVAAGRIDAYDAQLGLPLVLALAFKKLA
jgi:malonyl-CoA O-methyltransferase